MIFGTRQPDSSFVWSQRVSVWFFPGSSLPSIESPFPANPCAAVAGIGPHCTASLRRPLDLLRDAWTPRGGNAKPWIFRRRDAREDALLAFLERKFRPRVFSRSPPMRHLHCGNSGRYGNGCARLKPEEMNLKMEELWPLASVSAGD